MLIDVRVSGCSSPSVCILAPSAFSASCTASSFRPSSPDNHVSRLAERLFLAGAYGVELRPNPPILARVAGLYNKGDDYLIAIRCNTTMIRTVQLATYFESTGKDIVLDCYYPDAE